MPTIVEVEGVGEIEFPDGMSNDEIKSALDANFGPKQAPRTPTQELGRQAGLASRYLAEGVSTIPAMVGDAANEAINMVTRPINSLFGTNIPRLRPVSSEISGLLTQAGLPMPETSGERVVGDVSRGIAAAGGQAGVSARTALNPFASRVFEKLAAAPVSQLEAAAGAAGASGIAREAGAGPVGQTLAAVAGGVTVPAVHQGLAAAGRAVSGPRATPETRAVKAISKDAKTANLSPDDLMAEMNKLGPGATLSDLSDTLQRRARAVYTSRGEGAELARNYLEGRGADATRRTVADLKKITGKDTNYFDTVKSVLESRKAESAPLYAAADKASVPAGEVKALHGALIEKAKEAEGTQLAGALKRMASMLKSGDGFKTNVRQLHIVKTQIRDLVSRAYRSGSSNMGKDIDEQLRVLSNSKGTGILEKASPEYAQANKIFSDETAVLKALDSGRKVLSGDADEIAETIKNLSLAEKDAYLQGAVKAIRDKVLSGGKFNNDLIAERLRNVFDSDDAFKQFMSAVDREKTFAGTKNFVLGGSQTTNKAADLLDMADEAGTAVSNVMSGRFGMAAVQGIRKVLSGNKNIPERLRAPMARLLTTPEGSRRAVEMMKRAKVRDEEIRTILQDVRRSAAIGTAVGVTQ